MKKLEKITNYKIKDKKLFEQVLTHKSYAQTKENNERLEFLGDAVLGLIIADLLMKKYPEATEGDLTKKRAYLVSGKNLAELAKELEFHNHLRTSTKSYTTNERILAGTLEAYFGAIYLEGNFSSVKNVIEKIFEKTINKDIPIVNHKALLQEWCQKKYQETPVYEVKKEEGLQHEKTFFVDVFIKGKCYGSDVNRQKKQAEQGAAKKAVKKLKIFL